MLAIKNILHPTDFSKFSTNAFHLACSLARDHGAKITVLHVVTPPVVLYSEAGAVPPPPRQANEDLWAQLDQVACDDAGVQVERRLVEDEAPIAIINAAKEIKADLIVMGNHGRTGLSRFLMGSVAEQVLRKAPCPVLSVKAPMGEEC